MSSCEQTGNNSGNLSIPDPSGEGILRPEQNIPPISSKKEEDQFISPQEREAKRYRPMSSFARTVNKDEAEPELPHNKVKKDDTYLGQPPNSDGKLSIDIVSSDQHYSKNVDQIEINSNSSSKISKDINNVKNSPSKNDDSIDINTIPKIKIGNDIFVNSTRQVKNSSLEITTAAERKNDKIIKDTNVHELKNDSNVVVDTNRESIKRNIDTKVDGTGEFIKKNQRINAVEPTESVKISNEKNINAAAAFLSPKVLDSLNVDFKYDKKNENEIASNENKSEKLETPLDSTKQLEKDSISLDDPEDVSSKVEVNIASVDQLEKNELNISDAPEGKSKTEDIIPETKQVKKENININDSSETESKLEIGFDDTPQYYKIENEIKNTVSVEKELQEIKNAPEGDSKTLREISEETNRNSKFNEKDITLNAINSIGVSSPTVKQSEELQKTNQKYNITTPNSGELSENDYNIKDSLRNKDKADNFPAADSQLQGGNSNISFSASDGRLKSGSVTIQDIRKIKDSSEVVGAESKSGFKDNVSSGEVDAIIFNNIEKTEYNQNVFDKNYQLNNKNNANKNYIYEDQKTGFNSIQTNIDTTIALDSNKGKFDSETIRKNDVDVSSAINSPMGPPDQAEERYNYSNINNNGKKIKLSGDSVNANTFSSIDTTTDDIIETTIRPNDLKKFSSTENIIGKDNAAIINENIDYTDLSLPHAIVKNNIDFSKYAAEISTKDQILSAKDIKVNISGQENSDFDYTDFSGIVSRNIKISNSNTTKNYEFIPQEAHGFVSSTDTHEITKTDSSQMISGQYTSQVNYDNTVSNISKPDGTKSTSSIVGGKTITSFSNINFNNYKVNVLSNTSNKAYDSQIGLRTNIKLSASGSQSEAVEDFMVYSDFAREPSNYVSATNLITDPISAAPENTVNSSAIQSQQVAYTYYNISDFDSRPVPGTIITSTNSIPTSRQKLGTGGLKTSNTSPVNVVNDNNSTSATVTLSYDGTHQDVYDVNGNIIGAVYNNQENSNFNYDITNFGDRPIPTLIITTPDNAKTASDDSVTRQPIGIPGKKASSTYTTPGTTTVLNYSPINVVDDDNSTAATSYDGAHQDIYDKDGNVIGAVYNNQENSNFNYDASIDKKLEIIISGSGVSAIVSEKLDAETGLKINYSNYESDLATYSQVVKPNDRISVVNLNKFTGQERYNFIYDYSAGLLTGKTDDVNIFFRPKEGDIDGLIKNNAAPSRWADDGFKNPFYGFEKEFGETSYYQPSIKYTMKVSGGKLKLYNDSGNEVSGLYDNPAFGVSITDNNTKGLPISRDIYQRDSNSAASQLINNLSSSTGVTSFLSQASSIISNSTDLINVISGDVSKYPMQLNLNNDYANVLRRTLTTEIPSIGMSLARDFNLFGPKKGQDGLNGIADAITAVSDAVDTAGNIMNHPGAAIANAIRGQSSFIDVFGGTNDYVNFLTRGSVGNHGGFQNIYPKPAPNTDDYNIVTSYAVTTSQWSQDSGTSTDTSGLMSIFKDINKISVNTSGDIPENNFIGTHYEDKYGRNKIVSFIKEDLEKKNYDLKKLSNEVGGITGYATYKSLISQYESVDATTPYYEIRSNNNSAPKNIDIFNGKTEDIDALFKYNNRSRKNYLSVTQNFDKNVTDPHDIEQSININITVDNNYGGGRAAFVHKNKNTTFLLGLYPPFSTTLSEKTIHGNIARTIEPTATTFV